MFKKILHNRMLRLKAILYVSPINPENQSWAMVVKGESRVALGLPEFLEHCLKATHPIGWHLNYEKHRRCLMLKAGFGFERMRWDCERLTPGLVGHGEDCRIPALPCALGAGPLDLGTTCSPAPLLSSHDLSLTGRKFTFTILHVIS